MDIADLDTPLPGPPEPWASTDQPDPRPGRPYHMTEMIAAEPGLARRVLRRLADPEGPATRLAAAIRATAIAGRPILVTGCGTSEHGARAIVEILRSAAREAGLPWQLGAAGAPVAVQALEASLEAGFAPGTLVIGVSHEGATWATNRALAAATSSGATIALITVTAASPGAAMAEIVVTTSELDQSWCHTVGYLSPILAAGAVAGIITGSPAGPDLVASVVAGGLDPERQAAVAAIAGRLAVMDRILAVGSGVDRIAASELALKVEEGAHLPGGARDLETLLHGHLAATDNRTGLVLILTDPANRGHRTARALAVLRACREIGIAAAAIVAEVVGEEIDGDLTPAGRVTVPDRAGLDPAFGALLGTAVPLQSLTEGMAVARGIDPDPIRRDDPRYRAAAAAAEAAG